MATASAAAASAPEKPPVPYHLELVPAFEGGPMVTRAMAAVPHQVEYLRKEFDDSLKSEAELVDFLKTYDQNNFEQTTKLSNTIRYKRIKNLALWFIKHERWDIFAKKSYMGFDFDEVDDNETAFTYTVKIKNLYLFMKIGEYARLEALTDTKEGNALHRSIQAGYLDFVAGFTKLLAGRRFGYTPEEKLAILNKKRKVIANVCPLFMAIKENHLSILELLLAAGADPNVYYAKSEKMKIPLLSFAVENYSEMSVKILLAYGADPNIPRESSIGPPVLPADKAKSLGKVKVEKMLRNAMAKMTVISTPDYVSPKEPLKYMFSQRGTTCVTDAMFTIFLEADPIREDFQAALEDGHLLEKPKSPVKNHSTVEKSIASAIASIEFSRRDRVMEVFASVIPRYKKMKELEKKSPTRRNRKPSANAGEGDEILKCVTGSNSYGTTQAMAARMINLTLLQNKFGILKKNYHIGGVLIDKDRKLISEIPPFEKVFAYKITIGLPDRVWHAICMLKQGGKWFFGDNELGLLHPIQDVSIVEDFHKAASSPETLSTMAYVIGKGRKTSSDSMLGYLVVGNRHYPSEYGNFTIDATPINEVIMFFQESPTSPLPAAAAAPAEEADGAPASKAAKPVANEGGARRQTRRVRGAKRC